MKKLVLFLALMTVRPGFAADTYTFPFALPADAGLCVFEVRTNVLDCLDYKGNHVLVVKVDLGLEDADTRVSKVRVAMKKAKFKFTSKDVIEAKSGPSTVYYFGPKP